MKKILTLFAVVGLFAFSGCSNDDDHVDYDTISYVFDVPNVSFTPQNEYSKSIDNPSKFATDVVLVYRSSGSESNGNRIWKLLPETYFADDRGLDFTYTFQFSRDFIDIFMDGPDLESVNASYRLSQVFRVVIVPGSSTGTAKSINKEDYSDYNAVIKKFNIDDSNVKQLK
ncbi:hypothetical protein FLA105534_01752 [Flavobacterium bizetiae]|uniref:Lipoprotein n=1 Tax=Flavobacterium bizetiae TaxID=2704140 RepID=A0A6J4GEM4_9FLAO|nr:hypothetical protein [Flavobacterium bizetiae]CAA9197666.1 hypothetical protein FLA105534_01752 [Flavobacterium bizetiae]CAD5343663.1 hypothetical protein FLA105535_03664 [Flavobacterium bizetiae]CAD5348703.1 hypothetical protein FLA105534_02670 [Flavobacterium bizetiae]